ncbi:MAG: diguanylate cyclase [Acidobacteria bacterium]|nr:diguanylate cyclase [Acidobacteriota bacterium]
MNKPDTNPIVRPDTFRLDQILDTEPEPAFDDIARLAAQVAGCSVAVISLLSPEGPWLKSKLGLAGADFGIAMEFCNHLLGETGLLSIPDIRDSQSAWKPSVEFPGASARFLAGIPLISSPGISIATRPLGALAVLHSTPLALQPAQRDALGVLARQALTQLEIRKIMAELARTVGECRRAEDAQRESEERFRELFENANDIVYTHDMQERFTSLNRAGELATGYTRQEVLNMNISDVIAPEFLDRARQMMARKLAGEPPKIYEVEILGKDKRHIPLELSTRLIVENGQPAGIQGFARDVSERRQAAAALHSANEKLTRLVQDLQQRNHDQVLLSEMNEMLQVCESAQEAYNAISHSVNKLFPYLSGAFALLDPARHQVEVVAPWGRTLVGEKTFAPEECWALRRGRSHWVENVHDGPVCAHWGQPTRGNFLCVPLIGKTTTQGQALGTLHLQMEEIEGATGQRLSESTRALAETVSAELGLSLANLLLREKLRDQSIRDPLTGLFNRRYLEESLEREIRRAARKQSAMSVLMLDVDHFKRFNDTHGHDAGDQLLQSLAKLFQAHTRREDIACRYGGEEFTLVFPDAAIENAAQRAEQLRARASEMAVQHGGKPLGPVTLSLGAACFPAHGTDVAALLHAADQALYRAKSGGRNRVVLAG